MSTPVEATKPTEVVEKAEPMDTDPKPEAAVKEAEKPEEKPEAKTEEKAEEEKSKSEPEVHKTAEPAKKPETFFVETKNTPKKSLEGAKNAVKQKSIALRPELMKFPGAVRIHCSKTAIEGEYAIVIRIEKPEKAAEFKLPEEFGDLMKLNKEASEERQNEDGFYGEYTMTDKSYRVWIKLFEAGKIESLDEPKNCTGRLRNPRKTNIESEPADNTASGDAKPAESTKTAEAASEEAKLTDEPKQSDEPKPAEPSAEAEKADEPKPSEQNPADEAKPDEDEAKAMEAEAKPEKRPREDAAPEEAPAAKRAKVAEEEKPTDAAAQAAVC